MLMRIKANLHCLCPSSFVSCVQVLAMAAVKKRKKKTNDNKRYFTSYYISLSINSTQ